MQIPQIIKEQIDVTYSSYHPMVHKAAEYGFQLADAVNFLEWMVENTNYRKGNLWYYPHSGELLTSETLYIKFLTSKTTTDAK